MRKGHNQPGMGGSGLVGRDAEMAQLDKALAEAAEHGGALFVTGAAGIGDTSLLNVAGATARCRDYKALAITRLESEAELPYAWLPPLLHPVLPVAGRLTAAPMTALPG